MNIQQLLTLNETEGAFKVLKRKQYRKNFSELRRFIGASDRQINSLGDFIAKTKPEAFYSRDLKRFSFSPYQGVRIKKANGKLRPLLVPSAKDRVVLTAIYRKVFSVLKPVLGEYDTLGLGLKSDKETTELKRVLTKILDLSKNGQANYILKLDFKDFFSSIDRDILLRRLGKSFKGTDQRRIYRLIKKSVTNKIRSDSAFQGAFRHLKLDTIGIPQGLSYSPLLASLYALPLDAVSQRIHGCVSFRYLDDMIVITKTKRKAEQAYEWLKSKSKKLRLNLHELKPGSKTVLVTMDTDSFEFLGIGIKKDELFIPPDAVTNFKETFEREILNAEIARTYSFEEIMKTYRSYAGGWINHYKKLCPEDFDRVEKEICLYLDQYVEKHKTRKTILKIFGHQRLTLSPPFLRIKIS